jgi:hypothetical protein
MGNGSMGVSGKDVDNILGRAGDEDDFGIKEAGGKKNDDNKQTPDTGPAKMP